MTTNRNTTTRVVHRIVLLAACVLPHAGCYQAISIQPSCPAQLDVGETGELLSGVSNAGQIASFLWEVTPADAGTLGDAANADTTFTAAKVGTATLQLTASDGIYQVISQCETEIVAP